MSTLPIHRVRLNEKLATDGFDVYIEVESAPTPVGGSTWVMPLEPTYDNFQLGDMLPVATTLSRAAAQALLEGLWEAGLRPKDKLKPEPSNEAIRAEEFGALMDTCEDLRRELVKAKDQHIADLRFAAGILRPKDEPQTNTLEPRF